MHEPRWVEVISNYAEQVSEMYLMPLEQQEGLLTIRLKNAWRLLRETD